MSPFRLENQEGKPIKAGETLITPISQSFQLTVPGFTGGLIWNRPVGIRVQTANGQEQQIPVQDVTRLVLLGILGFSLLVALLSLSRR
jgi:hypothetical protein